MWDTKLAFKRLGCTPAFTDLASEVFALIVTPQPLCSTLRPCTNGSLAVRHPLYPTISQVPM